MANEFRHEDVGAQLSRSNWEGVITHQFASQATGDILYASSSTQLSRLGVGTNGNLLYLASGIPAWFNGLIFSNDGTKSTILGLTGDYTRFGDAGVTSHSLSSEDDLMVTGKLEVDGTAYFDGIVSLSENAPIALDSALSADGKYSGMTESGTAGATLAFGDLVYFAVADSRWELTDADAVATSFAKLGIVVLAAANDGSATTVLLWGKVRADVAFPTLTIGAPVHIGTTAGDIQVAAPSGSGDIVRIIGYGNTADELYFCPDNTYVEIA